MHAVKRERFMEAIRRAESRRNAGCTSAYDDKANVTYWIIADEVVGKSEGPLGTNGDYFLADRAF